MIWVSLKLNNYENESLYIFVHRGKRVKSYMLNTSQRKTFARVWLTN